MGNDREIDDETAALLTYLATPDGMEILKGGMSAVVFGVLIIGACLLWWPESEIAQGVVPIELRVCSGKLFFLIEYVGSV